MLVLGAHALTDDEHRRLAEVWGEPQPHPVSAWMGSDEVVAYVTNDADNPPIGDSDFHTDYTFNHEIAAVAVLQAQEVTSDGGDTIWADTHAAYDALSGTDAGVPVDAGRPPHARAAVRRGDASPLRRCRRRWGRGPVRRRGHPSRWWSAIR